MKLQEIKVIAKSKGVQNINTKRLISSGLSRKQKGFFNLNLLLRRWLTKFHTML